MTPDNQRCDCCGGSRWVPLFSERGYQLGQCPDCDLLYVDRMPSLQTRMTEMEGGHFAGGERALGAGLQATAEAARADAFGHYLGTVRQQVATGRWLDIGCGGGQLLAMARDQGFQVEGVELTTERRDVALRRGLRVHDQPIEELRLPAGSFDVISMVDVFSHLTRPSQTFAEIRRLLTDRGVLVVATGEARGTPRRHDLFSWNLGDHLYFLGARTLDAYAERTGFRVQQRSAAWLPSEIYSRARLGLQGRSLARNAIKKAIVTVPGGLSVFRRVMLRRERDNPLYSVTAVLKPTDPLPS